MISQTLLVVLSVTGLVAGHGKTLAFAGDLGGNGTGLHIMGNVVPIHGPNSKTEVDTTVFPKTNPLTDGMGKTTGQGKVQAGSIKQAMALSGNTLPQVSPGGTLTGSWLVVTSDGCGTVQGTLDTTASGTYSQGIALKTVQDVPGKAGNCPRSITKKSFVRDVLERSGVIERRATNVGVSFPVSFQIPADAPPCTGTAGGMQGVCFVKVANLNRAGPFGSNVPIQISTNSSQPGATVPGSTGTVSRRTAIEFSA